MEPTPDQAATMTTLADIAAWIPMTTDLLQDLCGHLGFQDDHHYRALGFMSQEWYQNELDKWKPSGGPPTPAAYSQAGILGRTSRYLCGTELSMVEQQRQHLDQLKATSTSTKELEDLKAQLADLKRKLDATPRDKHKKIKLSNVLDQANEEEINSLTQDDLKKAYERYAKLMGGPPAEDEEPTSDQLAGLAHVLNLNLPPYVDFAIFGAYGDRIQRKLKLSGLMFAADGSLIKHEVPGPPTFPDWDAAYKVLRTALIGLDIVCPAHLDLYRDHLHRLHSRYGSQVWFLIYQADVRARREHMERIRRKVMLQIDMGASPPEFDATKPWNFVWKAVVEDEPFWNKQVKEPAILVLAKTSTLNAHLGGDALADSSNSARQAQQAELSSTNSTRSTSAKSKAMPKNSPIKHHVVGDDGMLKANRKGVPICQGFQTGACTTVAPGTLMVSGVDGGKVHQCAKCLSPSHGASSCQNPPANKPKGKSGGKGKKTVA